MTNFSQNATARSAQPEIRTWDLAEIPNGRAVEIKDDCETYIAPLPVGMDLADAISAFSSTYDTNGESGRVHCDARLYLDGVETEFEQFVIEMREGV